MLYAGLDIHKITCQASVCTPDGTELKKGKIANTPDKIQKFFKEFDELTIAIEACANWEPVFEALEHAGHRVVLAHPLKTRMIAESKIKTDKIDASILAHLLRTGFLPTSYIPTKNMRDLRNQVRQRITLGKYRGKFKNKICAELFRRGIHYETGGAIFTAQGRRWLRSLKIPSHHNVPSHP
jgi:transposase